MPFSFRENCCHAILYPVGVFHYMSCTHSLLLGCGPEQLYVCLTLPYPILYFGAAALLYSMCALLYTTLFSTLLYEDLLYTTLFLAAAILYLYADVAIA